MGHEEELEKRRAQRDALRSAREAQVRTTRSRLIVAVVILILCAVVILVSVSRAPEQDPNTITQPPEQDPSTATQPPETTLPPATDPTETSPTETVTPETAETTVSTESTEPVTTQDPYANTVVHFVAGGDININDTTATLDYQQAFLDILPLLSQGDLTAVNFEGNLVGEPYGAASQSAPQSLMTALKKAGVDLIQVANSKTIANGLPGLSTTLSAIRSAGMEPVGAWATNEEAQRSGGYTIREVNGIRIALVAFTKGMDSMALPTGSEDCVNLLYTDYATTYRTVDTAGITAVLERVALEEPDITIALVHWGSEYRDQISSTQKTIRDLMLKNGVDAIIGTHPHYVQALEFDRENGTFVAYSLGDLLSDGQTSGTEYSIILDLEITKNGLTGQTAITGYSYTPIFNVRREGQPMQLMELEKAISAYETGYMLRVDEEMYEDMLYARTRIEARVQPASE